MDYSKLRGRIVEKFGTLGKFAEAMPLSTVSLSNRLSGSYPWKAPEIARACELLDIPLDEAYIYFFSVKS